MSTPPKYCLLVNKIPDARPARALGRIRQVYGGAGTFDIIPTAEALPFSNDANGQSYPAGTICVRQHWYPGWDDSAAVGALVSSQAIIPVPSILPAGYTHYWGRDHAFFPGSENPNLGQAWYHSHGRVFAPTGTGGRPPSHVRRIGGRFYDYWLSVPEAQGDGSYDSGVTNWATSWSGYATAGIRYVRWSSVPAGLTCSVRSYSDGHLGTTAAATNVHATFTGPGDSGFLAGPSFAVGEKRHLQYHFTGAGGILQVQCGARVDLPLPWTATGPTLVAPGGYVAAKLGVAPPT